MQRVRVAKDEGYQAGKASVSREILAQAAPPPVASPPSDKEIESKVKGIMSKVYHQLLAKFSGKKQYSVEEIKVILMTTIRVCCVCVCVCVRACVCSVCVVFIMTSECIKVIECNPHIVQCRILMWEN